MGPLDAGVARGKDDPLAAHSLARPDVVGIDRGHTPFDAGELLRGISRCCCSAVALRRVHRWTPRFLLCGDAETPVGQGRMARPHHMPVPVLSVEPATTAPLAHDTRRPVLSVEPPRTPPRPHDT